jgi:hypothetical protein
MGQSLAVFVGPVLDVRGRDIYAIGVEERAI